MFEFKRLGSELVAGPRDDITESNDMMFVFVSWRQNWTFVTRSDDLTSRSCYTQTETETDPHLCICLFINNLVSVQQLTGTTVTRVTRAYQGLQGLPGVTGGYRGLPGVMGSDGGLQVSGGNHCC